MGGIIRKAIRGAANTGKELYMEKARNDMALNRDSAFAAIQNNYRQQEQASNQEFTASQNQMDRDQRASEFDANQADAAAGRELQGRGLDIQEQGLELDREKLGLTAQQIRQELEQGSFGIVEANRLKGINDVISNPEATDEQVSDAVRMLENLKASNPDRYSFLKVGTGELGDPERVVRGNIATGALEAVDTGAPSYTEEEIEMVMLANPQGTREQAIRYLQQIKNR